MRFSEGVGGGGGFQLSFSEGPATSHPLSFEYFERIWRKGLCFMKREKNKRAISHGAADCDGNIFFLGGGVGLKVDLPHL